ncbi:hypothetical protein O0I10_001381 [Lichtheimia ornata]|uniref:YbaK/aminoacyl-tRNA synthetase-associated domain-containing protein n=1 Tax=Lichtheimia ornata TaxID=688661 RepID=A0AAD7Y3N1_9FUNG|nr:uncharacterized protein O0I10_001381 [Lichtheimia ornata]KAJ8663204.1 hypothetical protein O0I10_001381 [Lichtheimia ornata]
MFVSELSNDLQLAIESLNADIVELYKGFADHYHDQWDNGVKQVNVTADFQDSVGKVQKGCDQLGLTKVARYYHVESDYYDWPLRQRAFRVLAPSPAHMCKTVVMVNQGYSEKLGLDESVYPRYVCVVTQYIAPVNTAKLLDYYRGLVEKPAGKKFYNFRLAKHEISFELTGFRTGGVTPIGMDKPIPIILADSITKLSPSTFVMGAGHIDWKIALPVQDFIKATNCLVLDLE